MKNLIFLLLMMTISMASGQNATIHVIPQPVSLQQLNGYYVLTGQTTIGYNRPEARNVAEMLASRIMIPTGFQPVVQQGSTGAIQLNLESLPEPGIGMEGYVLESSSKGIVIKANEAAGLFYGIQTLLQLLPEKIESRVAVDHTWIVPAVKITDYPRFGWRGLMLDVSRHFFTKEEVKKYIDEMVKFKYNTFHWHLTDDNGWRIEIKSLPRLTEVGAWRVPRMGYFNQREAPKPGEPATYGGFYTHEDIREIVKYASERFVTIVPEIDVPGHSMAALAAYPELSCTKDPDTRVNPGSNFAEWHGDGTFTMFVDNTLNPSDEKVYEFLDKVFTEVAELFPGEYIHAGGDECYKGFWEKDKDCQALMKKLKVTDVEKLQGYFMERVEKILSDKGKKLIGWDEILEGGISPGASVMSWRGMEQGIEAAHLGHDVVMTPTAFTYLDYTQGDPTIDPPIYATLRMEKCYGFDPLPEGVDPRYILGGQGNLWTEQLPTYRSLEYMTYPRAWALSEVFWTPAEAKNWEMFIPRVENQFGRSDIAGTAYSRAIYDAIVSTFRKDGKLMLDLRSEIPGLDIHYTLNGTMPDDHSARYVQAVEVPDGPVTLRVITYREGKPIGHLITLDRNMLEQRAR
ncbi:MAG: family 20 glycosylhydrolase [Cyclobacteriaceae bacterium]|nr:family 20 glycosylhydrolase [Cyclobacteriaceae bacterium]